MDSNDPLKQEVLDVRKVIEKSTSKVSLRDLEKKGFRQVKVLRAGDINQLIFKAVQNVLAKQPRGTGMTEEEKQKILKEAKAEVDRQLAEAKRMQAEAQRMEAEAQRLEAQKLEIEEANRKLQEKVEGLNRQFLAEKKALEREKQALYERGLAGQEAAAKNYEEQLTELRSRLQRAEARADGAVPKAEYDRLRERFDRLQNDLEEAEEKARQARQALAEAESRVTASAGVDDLRQEIEERDARMRDLIQGLATTLQSTAVPVASSGEIPDLSKQFKALQVSLSDQIKKAVGGKGGADMDFEVTPEAIGQIFAQTNDIKLQANEVEIKETKATGVEDKLSKLKRMRGGK